MSIEKRLSDLEKAAFRQNPEPQPLPPATAALYEHPLVQQAVHDLTPDEAREIADAGSPSAATQVMLAHPAMMAALLRAEEEIENERSKERAAADSGKGPPLPSAAELAGGGPAEPKGDASGGVSVSPA